jgi:hypothetical protein
MALRHAEIGGACSVSFAPRHAEGGCQRGSQPALDHPKLSRLKWRNDQGRDRQLSQLKPLPMLGSLEPANMALRATQGAVSNGLMSNKDDGGRAPSCRAQRSARPKLSRWRAFAVPSPFPPPEAFNSRPAASYELQQPRCRHWDDCRHSVMIEPHELARRHQLDMLTPLLTISKAMRCTRWGGRKGCYSPEPHKNAVSPFAAGSSTEASSSATPIA